MRISRARVSPSTTNRNRVLIRSSRRNGSRQKAVAAVVATQNGSCPKVYNNG